MAEKFKILSVGKDSKGLNIFKSTSYKEHEQAPMAQTFWILRWTIAVWLVCAVVFGISFIIEHIWRYGWSPATAVWMKIYLNNVLSSAGLSVVAEIPYWIWRCVMHPDIPCIVPFLPAIAFFILTDSTLTKEFNPNGKDEFDKRSGREATEKDVKEMGLFDGNILLLGYFKKKPLKLPKTTSVLCLAPPGTGKTQGIVLPTIFECPDVSMIINDPKPEIDSASSGYRSEKVGPVFIMNWAGQDEPEKGIYYPSWNPLSPGHIPFSTEQRELYVDYICDVLVPDAVGSSADPHWTQAGRAGLAGFVQFIVSKIERAKADDYFYGRLQSGTFDADDGAVLSDYYFSMINDPNAFAAIGLIRNGELNAMNYVHIGTWANIPQAWLGKEASFSMMLDWITEAQIAVAQDLAERQKQGDQTVMMADPMKDWLEGAVNESRSFAYSNRAIAELTKLANTPSTERGSIISTILTGLGIFRNAAVRNRTSHSDFHFCDMRGMIDPRDGKMKPVTVYLSVNVVDAKALSPISSMFIETMSNFLLANPPGAVGRSGEKMGPYPVLFLLDEMPKMQKMQAVIQGPDVGRSQKISYLFIGQDLHQIQEKYGPDAASTILSTTAAKIVFRQNETDTATRFAKMIPPKIKFEKKKTKGPDGKETETKEKTEEPVFSEFDLMKLKTTVGGKPAEAVVLYEGYYHRPIKAEMRMAFSDPKMAEYIKMGRSSPLPEFLIPLHHATLEYAGIPRYYNPQKNELKDLTPVTL
ncbi:MAG: type IV secretory system conjugative DNA transfer family protein [Alphaproteobacteria bacterium]|nr:type IV secretory system conjugative DNA transfer family protein [Alphaproteobacteria bacterium]